MKGRTDEEAERDARELCETFNRCRYSGNLGFRYEVEEVEEDSPLRAPPK